MQYSDSKTPSQIEERTDSEADSLEKAANLQTAEPKKRNDQSNVLWQNRTKTDGKMNLTLSI